jgi:hypothetical protein
MKKKRVVITVATGMVGGLALQTCLGNPDVFRVTAMGKQLHKSSLP